jgi:cAMP-dependent protein kinase regulator
MADAEGVQQELQDYLHKKGINTLFINLVESLLLAKPENPILHIIQYLQANYPEEATPRAKNGAPLGKDDNPASPSHNTCASDGLRPLCSCLKTKYSRCVWTRRPL